MIYLDNAATTWPKPEGVSKAVKECMDRFGANPGRGGHRLSRSAGETVEETRRLLARLFGVRDPKNMIFCQNGTHAINLALRGWLRPGDHVVTSRWEHNAVARPLEALKKEWDIRVDYIPSGKHGPLDLDRLKTSITRSTRLIVITHASNVTGSVMPLEKIATIAAEKGVPLLVDAAQTAGVLPIDVESMGISMLAFPGHKGLMGPQGTGGLFIAPGLEVRPLVQGGTGSRSEELRPPEERPCSYESGTLNTPGIAGLGAGIRFLMERGVKEIHRKETLLIRMLQEGIQSLDGVRLYIPEAPSVPVVSFNVEGVDGTEVAAILDQHYGIAVRAGYHCAALAHRALGTAETGTVRASPGYFNTEQDVSEFIQALREIQQAFAGF
ncbi:cysteine desulfurase family protein [Melghirimyces profundicolus]|uniref:cysteine desulfurase n=1 Tax=Melghirimyces profundicolus TaxID=1242148 RepID=A0A2T6C274_9BACL|nr:aminotransferase class V-fold PLP-dependent enzyme [Melghirimyces profundicolus]PTX62419.1 cysteine desulfurase family protein [Melghirimyces profundicolus]